MLGARPHPHLNASQTATAPAAPLGSPGRWLGATWSCGAGPTGSRLLRPPGRPPPPLAPRSSLCRLIYGRGLLRCEPLRDLPGERIGHPLAARSPGALTELCPDQRADHRRDHAAIDFAWSTHFFHATLPLTFSASVVGLPVSTFTVAVNLPPSALRVISYCRSPSTPTLSHSPVFGSFSPFGVQRIFGAAVVATFLAAGLAAGFAGALAGALAGARLPAGCASLAAAICLR